LGCIGRQSSNSGGGSLRKLSVGSIVKPPSVGRCLGNADQTATDPEGAHGSHPQPGGGRGANRHRDGEGVGHRPRWILLSRLLAVRGNGNQHCPVAHSLLSDTGWIGLHWTSWSEQQALGYGEQVHENALCSGEPLVCRAQVNPIDIHLSRPKVCPGGARIWSRIDVIERATNSRRITGLTHWRYACIPSEPSIGLGGGGG
jgi:hypothetical protein